MYRGGSDTSRLSLSFTLMTSSLRYESMQKSSSNGDGHSPCAASLCGTANHTEQGACGTVIQKHVHNHVWAEAADTKQQSASYSHSRNFCNLYWNELGRAHSTLRERSTKKTSVENPEWRLFGRSRRRWEDDIKMDGCRIDIIRSAQGSVACSCQHVNEISACTECGVNQLMPYYFRLHRYMGPG
jgi:hypothetical protein